MKIHFIINTLYFLFFIFLMAFSISFQRVSFQVLDNDEGPPSPTAFVRTPTLSRRAALPATKPLPSLSPSHRDALYRRAAPFAPRACSTTDPVFSPTFHPHKPRKFSRFPFFFFFMSTGFLCASGGRRGESRKFEKLKTRNLRPFDG